RHLHSFPTRRSSDLYVRQRADDLLRIAADLPRGLRHALELRCGRCIITERNIELLGEARGEFRGALLAGAADDHRRARALRGLRSEEHTSELQSLAY